MMEQTVLGTALEKPKPTSAMGSVRADKTKMAGPPWPRTILWRASNDVCFCSFTIASRFFHSYRLSTHDASVV
ncbi:hypothetical protein H5410_055258 [Solanum commersonii]|uniref:Uncharacterized protein n=1 Tax=Solanum commersonii TaxID=4109 RepID=A0A9J5WIT5_SOLCO|nr:hypothetical protein H5410_055258 [Solanum commersonii]